MVAWIRFGCAEAIGGTVSRDCGGMYRECDVGDLRLTLEGRMRHPLAIDPTDIELAGLRANVDLALRPDYRARPNGIGGQANVARPLAQWYDGIDGAKSAAGRRAPGSIFFG